MNLTELRKLAEATNRGEWSEQVSAVHEMMERLSPERILAMLDVIEAADAWRNEPSGDILAENACVTTYDAARKRLDAGRTMTIKWTEGKVDRLRLWTGPKAPADAISNLDLADALDECVAALRYIVEVAPVCADDDAEMAAHNALRKIGAEP